MKRFAYLVLTLALGVAVHALPQNDGDPLDPRQVAPEITVAIDVPTVRISMSSPNYPEELLDEQVRRLSYAILNRRGYTVLAAENGNTALKMLESHEGPLHLLLSDVVMPGFNVKELSTKVTEKYPGVKVLYMSGYTDNVIAHRGVLKEGVAFIQKPFTVQGLAAKVREVLERGQA